MKILVMAAHPDDEALGCGGTIKKFIEEGHDVRVLTFTDGGGARFKGDDRRQQLIASSEILGFSILDMFAFPDNAMDVVSLLDINKAVEKQLVNSKFTPDVIMTHNPWCLNVDHKKVFECAQVISRMQHNKVMCFEIPSSSEWNHVSNFVSNCYVRLTKQQVKAKLDALEKCYKTEMREHPHPRSIDGVFNQLKYNGSIIGVEFAERFMVTKEVL